MLQEIKKGRLLVGAGIGITDDILKRVEGLIKEEVDVIVVYTVMAILKCC